MKKGQALAPTAADMRVGSVIEAEVYERDDGIGDRQINKKLTVNKVSPYYVWFDNGTRRKITALDVDLVSGVSKIVSI